MKIEPKFFDWSELNGIEGTIRLGEDSGYRVVIFETPDRKQYVLLDNLADADADADRYKRERDEAVAELRNIRDAKPEEWDIESINQFKDWAQNRARHTLSRIEQADKGNHD